MSATVLHDDNGNITSWGSTSYAWNARNQLVAISGTSLTASFKYDAVGRRVEKTINGTTTKYLYDGADIIMEMNGSGTPTVFYVRTLNIDEPLARIDLSSGEIRYYHADALGSIIALTDENGTVKTQYNYSPFGDTEVINLADELSDNPFMFTGREWDGATGLYYYRNRYQSPILGRFISEDPIGLAGGINFYSYVGNRPVNFVDPLGLDAIGRSGGAITSIFSSSGPIGYFGGAAIGAAAYHVLIAEAGLATAPAIVTSIVIVMIADPILAELDEIFFPEDFRTSEDYLLKIREAKYEGNKYIDDLLNNMQKSREELEKLNRCRK